MADFRIHYMLTNLKAHRRRHLHQQRFADKCDISTLTASNWCGILALRPDLADKFEASTRDWSADEPKASDECAMISPKCAFGFAQRSAGPPASIAYRE